MKTEPIGFLPLLSRIPILSRIPSPISLATADGVSSSIIIKLSREIVQLIVVRSWRQLGSRLAGLLNNPAGLELVLENYV